MGKSTTVVVVVVALLLFCGLFLGGGVDVLIPSRRARINYAAATSSTTTSTSEEGDGSKAQGPIATSAPQSEQQLDNVAPEAASMTQGDSPSTKLSKAAAAKCNDTAGDSSRTPLYPCSLDAYRHPFGTCGKRGVDEPLVSVEHSKVMGVNKSIRLWPQYPDHRMDFATEHERCHYSMARMLVIFTAVMRELGLKNWFITHGTLLGAARHGGFIPWDVDIDVVMPRSHITLLRKMWRKHFPRDMFLQSEKTESSFHMWTGKERAMRVKDRYSTFQGVRFSMMKKGKKYRMKKWHLGAQIDIIPLERKKGYLKILHHIIDPALVHPINETCFENIMLPAPANISGFLEALYGPDYMEVPKDAKFQGPTTLPCLGTHMSPGSAWSLSWQEDYRNASEPVLEPRSDPHGSFREDFRVPYTLYYNSKG